ncbi:MAG TPA: mandelate racemase/muconate lactonizing enzyme family protein [Gemmataceae bacterium]|nr:mandelate racemase/muconate lactonizing enzyme family protein [Gemmataceae bacterium]
MRISGLTSKLLRVPLDRPIAPAVDHVFLLLVQLDTDAGLRGLGFAWAIHGGGRAMLAVAEDDLTPLVVGEDPLDHERLAAKVYWRLQGIGRRGLVQQAYSAVDLALWDLKGKAGNLPLYKLLGGARESAPAYGGDAAWPWMPPEQIIDVSQEYLSRGFTGVKLHLAGDDPEKDAGRVQRVRDALGEDLWLGVDAHQRYDFSTALAMGRFLDEEIRADWLEEPLSCEDVEGHARLAQRLEVPLALGESLYHRDEFERYLERDAVAVLQPDVTRLGGLTPFLRVAALAERHHQTIAPHLMPELAVHLACGLPSITLVEYMPWFFPFWVEPPAIVGGKIVPPSRPGLGLEVNAETVRRSIEKGSWRD